MIFRHAINVFGFISAFVTTSRFIFIVTRSCNVVTITTASAIKVVPAISIATVWLNERKFFLAAFSNGNEPFGFGKLTVDLSDRDSADPGYYLCCLGYLGCLYLYCHDDGNYRSLGLYHLVDRLNEKGKKKFE